MLQQFYPQVQHPYVFELNKDMHFAAAHFIPHPDAGNCANVHGHTYFVNITIAGDELDHTGFLVNFGDIKKLIHKRYDHSVMNHQQEYTVSEREPGKFPTTELVAENIFHMIQDYLDSKSNKAVCVQVVVRETPTSYVVYRPRG